MDTSGTTETAKGLKKLPFSSLERQLIGALVRDRPIIEEKRIHAKNIELKRQAWDELTDAFNAQPYVSQRSCVQLKRCWENFKSQRKRELSQGPIKVNNISSQGGGPVEEGSTSKKKRWVMNIQRDRELHEFKIQKEKLLIERATNIITFEKELHKLQLEKLKLEIEVLKNQNKVLE